MGELANDIAGIGALADETRRDLYLYVSAQPGAVGREQAAEALGLPLHQAKFHLDRLEQAGLLVTEYARLTGRTGPGAGRPSKLYRRAPGEVAVSLPEREYALAGDLMAEAISAATSTGVPVSEALADVARRRGREIGAETPARGGPLTIAIAALRRHGYEPRHEHGRTVLANCPFHSLAREHTELVCGMSHALVCGVVDEVGDGQVEALLEPGEDRCCVVLQPRG